MAGIAPQTVIGATTSASANGTVAFSTTPINKFAVHVVGPNLSLGTTVPSFLFSVSWDGATYQQLSPAYQRGNTFFFDVPALNIGVSFGGNAAGVSVTVLAVGLTD